MAKKNFDNLKKSEPQFKENLSKLVEKMRNIESYDNNRRMIRTFRTINLSREFTSALEEVVWKLNQIIKRESDSTVDE